MYRLIAHITELVRDQKNKAGVVLGGAPGAVIRDSEMWSLFRTSLPPFFKGIKKFYTFANKTWLLYSDKNGDIGCYSGVLCVGELGGACVGWFSQVVDYSAVAVCSFYLCLFGEEREALGGVDGGDAVWGAGFGDWFYFCYEPLDRSTRSTRSTRFFQIFSFF